LRQIALVAFGVLLLLPGLGRMGAMDSTDARYLAIAREMARSGHWVVPQLGGAPHLDKPPLAYWGSIVGERIAGSGEFGGRSVEQLALIATALVVADAARRVAGPRWSLVAGLATLATGLTFALSRGVATDLYQLAFVTPALVLLHDGAVRRSAARVVAAFALLGVSMWAKGPIGLLVAASVWLATAVAVRKRAALPPSGVAIGLAVFAAVGIAWFVLVAQREPGVVDWLAGQLEGRLSGTVGHVKGATYLVRVWMIGLLPWTPLVALALWRLRPRGPWREADPTDVFLIAWTVAPLVLFSLFVTKLPSYLAPIVPGAVLALVRAASRGLLDDRAARIALGAAALATVVAALGAGAAILAESQLGWDAVPRLAVHDGVAARLFGAALAVGGIAGAALLPRLLALDLRDALAAIAVGAGAVLAAGFHATAIDLPTLRGEGELIAGVPGARVVAFTFQPSLFYYAEPAATVYVAGVRGLVEPFVDAARARRLELSRDEALALLREDAPTFALIDAWQADDLAALADTRVLRRARKYALLANPAAQRALAASSGPP
jgi:4-amino-4-deoxy-L-arabinose transferase-like glycosyltransferase